MKSNFFTFDNLVKGGGILITVTALYWGIINRINLMEAKLDYYISNSESGKKRGELVVQDLKTDCKETNKELAELKRQVEIKERKIEEL